MNDSAALQRPDPVATANIYCDRLQDEFLYRVIFPFWQELSKSDPRDSPYLWFVRYPKCGEHVKIRIHCEDFNKLFLRTKLQEMTSKFFSALPPAEPLEPRRDGKGVPPIDAEDYAETDYPDRTLLWTGYRRSHVSLGGKPFLDDDLYAVLLTSCLGRGAAMVLAALKPGPEGQYSHSLRQTILLRLLIGGLASLGFPSEKCADYLAYHRDWLIRFTLLTTQAGIEKSAGLLAHFDQRAEQMGASLDRLKSTAFGEWTGEAHDRKTESLDDRWRSSLADLLGYVSLFRENPDYRLDPFASDPVFSPVFKVFHGVANQLGLGMLNEALAHHLLFRATGIDAVGHLANEFAVD
ncbi:MAG TPA: lantibiotic dehydratase C-terminal domain-containing protein [Thermoanaerobaculia bacterium]|jgi:hypothetical protein|nr:lantibiotic dehydratase C-terminal domain-containing protein [Thermoanaerobaculia bacterium]